MNREAVNLVDDLKRDAAEKLDPTAMRRTGSVRPDTSALANSTVQPGASGPKRNLSERITSLLSKLNKALEGDHESHHYFGM
jgi:hypothetical protein